MLSPCPLSPQSSHGYTLKQFMDIFSLPEMTLLSCVNDFFMRHNIDYEPVHLYKDVKVKTRVGSHNHCYSSSVARPWSLSPLAESREGNRTLKSDKNTLARWV